MSDTSRSQSDAVAWFFHKYPACLEKDYIPEKQRRWHVRRPGEFIKDQKSRRIKGLSGTDFDRHLETTGRKFSF